MRNMEFFKGERKFYRLEKLDDEVVNIISMLDSKGMNVETLVERYIGLDPHDEDGYRRLKADLLRL